MLTGFWRSGFGQSSLQLMYLAIQQGLSHTYTKNSLQNKEGFLWNDMRNGFVFFQPNMGWIFGVCMLLATTLLVLLIKEIIRRERVKATLQIKQIEAEKLHELDKLKSHFFAIVSREFCTPLTLIKGTTEKIQHKSSHTADKPELDLIIRNSNWLLQLINQLSDISKLEAGQLSLQPQPGEFTGYMKLLGSAFVPIFESKKIAYHQQLPAEPCWVLFDADKLEKMIGNLLLHAYQFTAPQGQVIFYVELLDKDNQHTNVHIHVKATGIGSGQIAGIFDQFQQADTTAATVYEGADISLALVKELVDLHQGKIWVERVPEEGSTFYIEFPLGRSPVATGQKTPAIHNHFYAAGVSPEGTEEKTAAPEIAKHVPKQLLLIENNADLRYSISSHLAASYHVLTAENGFSGYHQALEAMPDLIISDVLMPDMDGITLCHKLKTNERTSHIPLLLLTSKADTESKWQELDTGADAYLVKPFQMPELEISIKKLIEACVTLQEKYNQHIQLNPQEVKITSTDKRFLQKALAIVEANVANTEFDVEGFSKEIGMSRAHLHRKLTALTAQSPSEFIRNFRLKRAASLLLQHCGNVSEVAYLVGFSSLNYFTKCFREYYGQTPTEYQRSNIYTEEKR
jgi:signal transduction histidine kinase/DNA-binding response OmpR family regulator